MDKIKYIVIIFLIYLVITNIYTFNKQYFTTTSKAPSQINLSPSIAPSIAPSNTIASALLKLKTAPKLTSLVIQTSSGSETVQCMGSCNKCVLSSWTPSGCTVTEAT
jgi:hypothetical protein